MSKQANRRAKRALRTEMTRDEMIILRLTYAMSLQYSTEARRDRGLAATDLFSASRGLDPLTIQRVITELVREYAADAEAARVEANNRAAAAQAEVDEKRRREALALKAKYEELGNELRRRGLLG